MKVYIIQRIPREGSQLNGDLQINGITLLWRKMSDASAVAALLNSQHPKDKNWDYCVIKCDTEDKIIVE